MTGQEMSPTPGPHREAIEAALGAVAVLKEENGQPLKERLEGLVEGASDIEIAYALYEAARASLADLPGASAAVGWQYPLENRDEVSSQILSADRRVRSSASQSNYTAPLTPSSGGERLQNILDLLSHVESILGTKSAVHSTRSVALAQFGQIEDAVASAQAAVDAASTPHHLESALRNLAHALLLKGDAKTADEVTDKAESQFGASRYVVFHRACANAIRGDFEAFTANAEELHSAPPRHDPASWSELVESRAPWFASHLNRAQSEVLGPFHLDALGR